MHLFLFITCNLVLVRSIQTQYMNFKHRTLDGCETGSTAMVEQFFNVIFTEFHKAPPVCVCVQMCPDQATYCYPNGCLRRSENKIGETTQVTNSQDDRAKNLYKDNEYNDAVSSGEVRNMYIVKSHNDRPRNMFLYNNVGDGIDKLDENNFNVANSRISNNLIYRPNPFKEMVFKYKRLPKIAMKYNLREQVRNKNAGKARMDNLNTSKTRWSATQHINNRRGPIHTYKTKDVSKSSNYFVSTYPEMDTSKHLYKYLSKRENAENKDATYLYKTEAGNFSLDALIDNIIESTLDDINNTIQSEVKMKDSREIKEITPSLVNSAQSLSNFSANEEEKYILSNMITSLSKKIDEQNKFSIEIAEKLIENKIEYREDEEVKNNSELNHDLTNRLPMISINSTNNISKDIVTPLFVRNKITAEKEKTYSILSLKESTKNINDFEKINVSRSFHNANNEKSSLFEQPNNKPILKNASAILESTKSIEAQGTSADKSSETKSNKNASTTFRSIRKNPIKKSKQRVSRKLQNRKIN